MLADPISPEGPRSQGPRMVWRPDHPISPPCGVVAYYRLVLYDKIGPGTQACHWCGRSVVWTTGRAPNALVVDHLDWNRRNDDPGNLVPSCNSCNARRATPGKRNGIAPSEPVVMMSGNPTRAVERVCVGCGIKFLTAPSRPTKYHSRECWAKHYRANVTPKTPRRKEVRPHVRLRDPAAMDARNSLVRKQYEAGATLRELAAGYAVTPECVGKWVRAAGGETRNGTKRPRGRKA